MNVKNIMEEMMKVHHIVIIVEKMEKKKKMDIVFYVQVTIA